MSLEFEDLNPLWVWRKQYELWSSIEHDWGGRASAGTFSGASTVRTVAPAAAPACWPGSLMGDGVGNMGTFMTEINQAASLDKSESVFAVFQ